MGDGHDDFGFAACLYGMCDMEHGWGPG